MPAALAKAFGFSTRREQNHAPNPTNRGVHRQLGQWESIYSLALERFRPRHPAQESSALGTDFPGEMSVALRHEFKAADEVCATSLRATD